jgi:hypothetical protein
MIHEKRAMPGLTEGGWLESLCRMTYRAEIVFEVPSEAGRLACRARKSQHVDNNEVLA